MKITKLLVVALTATLMCGTVNANAYAAEKNTAEIVTELESTEQSTNEYTVNENISIEESSKQETEKTVVTETEKEDIVEENVENKETKKEETKKATKTTTAKKATTTKKTTTKTTAVTPKTTNVSYTKEQLRLLSSLIFCEAGSEPYAGKVAVGIVVMNRVSSKSFPSTLSNVIYQKYQFGPVRNGSLNKALANYDAGRFTTKSHKECIEAAKAALSGVKSVTYNGRTIDMKSTLYFSGRVSGAKFSIANHQFK